MYPPLQPTPAMNQPAQPRKLSLMDPCTPIPPPPGTPPNIPPWGPQPLTEAASLRLTDFLLSGVPDDQIQARMHDEFLVTIPIVAFDHLWDTVCLPRLLARRDREVRAAKAIAAEVEKEGPAFDLVVLDAITRKSMALALDPNADPAQLKTFFNLS